MEEYWFQKEILCKLGSGSEIDFWRFEWFAPQPLKDVFPAVFDLVNDPWVMVCNACSWLSGVSSWKFGINTISISADVRVQLQDLHNILDHFLLDPIVEDFVLWWQEPSDFSIKAAYKVVSGELFMSLLLGTNLSATLNLSWCTSIPSNIHFYAWRLLLRRLLKKDVLAHRGVL